MILCSVLLLLASESGAQPLPSFERWNNIVWKLSWAMKGYYFDDVSILNPPEQKFRRTEKRWGVTTADRSGTFVITIYEKGNDGTCVLVDTLNLQYFSGSGLDFVASFTNGSALPGSDYSTGLMRVVGKLNAWGTALNSAVIEPLGAYSLVYDNEALGDLAAFRLEIRGKLSSKLGCTLQR